MYIFNISPDPCFRFREMVPEKVFLKNNAHQPVERLTTPLVISVTDDKTIKGDIDLAITNIQFLLVLFKISRSNVGNEDLDLDRNLVVIADILPRLEDHADLLPCRCNLKLIHLLIPIPAFFKEK